MMTKKRKSMASRLDEGDRSMHATFCSAANSLSQLYTHAMNQQKLSFQAGERHALEKLYQWMSRQHEEGSRVTLSDILSYLQTELDYGEDSLISPRIAQQQHYSQSTSMQFTNKSNQAPSVLFAKDPAPRPGHPEQTKNPVFTSAMSSPERCCLQPYQLAQVCSFGTHNILHTGNGSQISDSNLTRENHDNSTSFNDSAMDMQSDSPVPES